MAKLFYDHLIELDKIEKKLKKSVHSKEDREELERLIDELIHHKVIGCIFDELPQKHHQEFVVKLHTAPHDESLLDYLTDKVKKDMGEFIRTEILSLIQEIIDDMNDVKSRK